MIRSSQADGSRRSFQNATRVTLKKADDSKKMQEAHVDGTADEKWTGVERMQDYGFTSVPLDEDGPGRNDKTAEGLVVHVGGARGHPVIMRIDDRRHRMKDLQKGESAQYDDQKQKVHIKRNAIVSSTKKKNRMQATDDNGAPKSAITLDKDELHVRVKKIHWWVDEQVTHNYQIDAEP